MHQKTVPGWWGEKEEKENDDIFYQHYTSSYLRFSAVGKSIKNLSNTEATGLLQKALFRSGTLV